MISVVLVQFEERQCETAVGCSYVNLSLGGYVALDNTIFQTHFSKTTLLTDTEDFVVGSISSRSVKLYTWCVDSVDT